MNDYYFDFQNLDAFDAAMDFAVLADELAEALDRRKEARAYLRDQLRRAANSILANTVEGAAEYAQAERARFYRMARRSAMESAAHVLFCQRRDLIDKACLISQALNLLHRLVSMLTGMVRRAQQDSRKTGRCT